MNKIYFNDKLTNSKHCIEYPNCYEYETLDEGVLNIFKNSYVCNTDPTLINGKWVKGKKDTLTDDQKSLKIVRYISIDIDGNYRDPAKAHKNPKIKNTSFVDVTKFLDANGIGYIYYTGTSHKTAKEYSYHLILDIDIAIDYDVWSEYSIQTVIKNWFMENNIHFDFSVNTVNKNLSPNPSSDENGVVEGNKFPLRSIFGAYLTEPVESNGKIKASKSATSPTVIRSSINRFITDDNKKAVTEIIAKICNTIHILQKPNKKGKSIGWYGRFEDADYFTFLNCVKACIGDDGKDLIINASNTWVDDKGQIDPIWKIIKNWESVPGIGGFELLLAKFATLIYDSRAYNLIWMIDSLADDFCRATGVTVDIKDELKAVYNEKTNSTRFYDKDNKRVYITKKVKMISEESDISAIMLSKTVRRSMMNVSKQYIVTNIDLVIQRTIAMNNEIIEKDGRVAKTEIRQIFKECTSDSIQKYSFSKLFNKKIEELYEEKKIGGVRYYFKKASTSLEVKKDTLTLTESIIQPPMPTTTPKKGILEPSYEEMKRSFKERMCRSFDVIPKKEENVFPFNSYKDKAMAKLAGATFFNKRAFDNKKTNPLENFIDPLSKDVDDIWEKLS